MESKDTKKIGIVYHYLAHYRLPVFRELMSNPHFTFHLISSKDSGNNIKTIDPSLSNVKITDGGLNWHFVKNVWFNGQLFLWQRGLMKHIAHQNYDGVIFLGNIYYLSTWLAIFYLKLKGRKIYFWTHGVTSKESGIKWRIRKFFYSLADGLMLYGHKAKETMVEQGFADEKLTVIYNSLDYKKQSEYRITAYQDKSNIKEYAFPNPNLPLMVFVGRLTSQKKLSMIIDALEILQNQNYESNLLLIGSGEYHDELTRKVSEKKLQNHVQFYGACYDEETLARLIGNADICVSPGEVGLTAITSLSYGTPVITHGDFNHQMPEYEAIIPGVNGDLFQKDSVEDLAKTIKEWLESHKDVPRKTIAEKCYQIIDDKYNPQRQSQLISDTLLKN